VTALAVGQRVLLPVGVGTWASHVIATAALLIPLPDAGDPVQLSMLVVNPPTASLLLSDIVALEPGDWVIQNAANSAVGGYVVQLAKRRGLRTVNVVRREGAIAEVEEAGGDVVLLDGPDLAKRIAQATERARIKLGIDAVGGKATDHLAQSVAIGGTVVNYGGMSGVPCSITPGSLIFRNVTLRGFWLANWFRNSSVNQQKALFGELAMLVAAGALSARVHATYPLEQIKDAIAAAASGERVGKIVLVPTATPQ
jgi:NADPH:quinone reductase-like Zn-dependent oxidoreductase